MARKYLCVLLLLWTALLGGCDWFTPESSLDLTFSSLGRATEWDRRRSLFMIRQAWAYRPEGTDTTELTAERRFINRYGSFARKLKSTESARDAAQLWGQITSEHVRRFPDAGY